jgi:hypothetical protein
MLALALRKKLDYLIFDDFYCLFQTNQAMDRALFSMQNILSKKQTLFNKVEVNKSPSDNIEHEPKFLMSEAGVCVIP